MEQELKGNFLDFFLSFFFLFCNDLSLSSPLCFIILICVSALRVILSWLQSAVVIRGNTKIYRKPFKSICDLSFMCAQSLSVVQLFATLWTVPCQTPLSMEFSRKEYWSGLPFPSPGNLPDRGMELVFAVSPELAGIFITIEPHGKPSVTLDML